MKKTNDRRGGMSAEDGPGGLLFAGVAIFLWCTAVALVFWPLTLEDAFITFRYAERFAEGYGIGMWNREGDRVEGYTTFLWMLVLGSLRSADISPMTSSKLLGLLGYLMVPAAFLFCAWQSRIDTAGRGVFGQSRTLLVAAVMSALWLPLAWYSVSGMETAFFAGLTGWCLMAVVSGCRGQAIHLGVAGVLLVLCRPEGVLVAGACWLFAMVRQRHRNEPAKSLWICACVFAATAVILTALRLIVFSDVVPNTYHAKAGAGTLRHLYLGIRYILGFTWPHTLLLAALGIGIAGGLRKTPDRLVASFMAIFLGTFVLYVAKVGGDNLFPFPYWRHFVHVSPFLFLGAAAGVVTVARGLTIRALVVGGACVLIADAIVIFHHLGGRMREETVAGVSTWPTLNHAPHNAFYDWMNQITTDDTVVAASLAGELAYVVDAHHIDTLGLNNTWIARNGTFDPHGPQDSKSDMAWVMEQRPDIVECYMSGRAFLEGKTALEVVDNWRRKMCVETLTSPVFLAEYLLVTNAPYFEFDRAVFVHHDWWENHPRQGVIHCTPVLETEAGRTVDGLDGGKR